MFFVDKSKETGIPFHKVLLSLFHRKSFSFHDILNYKYNSAKGIFHLKYYVVLSQTLRPSFDPFTCLLIL